MSTPVKTRSIMVATDTSAASDQAIRFAASLAKNINARLFITHVIAMPMGAYAYAYRDAIAVDETPDLTFERSESERAKAECEEQLRRIAVKVPYELLIRIGHTSATIIEELKKQNADLLVIGAHGRTGIGKVIFGSIAQQLLHSAPCPVLVAGPGAANVDPETLSRGVLVATDFSDPSHAALATAAGLAESLNASLSVLHVVPDGSHFSFEEAMERAVALHNLQKLATELPPTVHGTLDVAVGDAAKEIIRSAAARNVGVIVMGAHGTGAFGRAFSSFLGGTAYAVVRDAPCPVLTVTPQATRFQAGETRATAA